MPEFREAGATNDFDLFQVERDKFGYRITVTETYITAKTTMTENQMVRLLEWIKKELKI